MAVTAFRALATAHVQGTWNRLRKQLGGAAAWAVVLFLLLVGGTGMAPLITVLGVVGFLIGQALDSENGPRVVIFASAAVSGFTFIMGMVGGFASGSRQLPWEVLRGFPVRSWSLFLGELFAGAGEAITLFELLAVLSFSIGASLGAPSASPLFIVLGLTHALMLLSLQQLFGSLAQRVSKRFVTLLVLLPVAAVAMSTGLPVLLQQVNPQALWSSADRLDGWTALLPARFVFEAAREVTLGTASVRALVTSMGFAVLSVAAVTLGAWAFVARESSNESEAVSTERVRLWGFERPVMGVARLQWETLVRSLPGRFALAMPLLTIILIRGPMAAVLPLRAWTAPAAFTYAALASTNLLFNQFGLDRHGVKVLFLLPVDPLALLHGKLMGFAAWHGLQTAILLGLLVLTGFRDPVDLAVGVSVSFCIFLILAMVGQFASIWQPRPLKKNGMRASQPPLVVSLLVLGTLVTTALLVFGVVYGIRAFAPGYELAALLGVMVVLLGLVTPVAHFNALFLARSREKLVEVLGAAA